MTRNYITDNALRWLEIVISERFGHVWHLMRDNDCLRLHLASAEGAIIFDTLFQDPFSQSHPNLSCAWWDPLNEGWQTSLGSSLPAPFASNIPRPLIRSCDNTFIISYDIPGLLYIALGRVEEVGSDDLDNHERFSATSSHAFKFGYLHRPVVDEWLDLLGQVIHRQWPDIVLKKHEFKMQISHDVDRPSMYAFKSWKSIARIMVGNAFKRRDPKAFFAAPYVKIASTDRLMNIDPYNTFDWLMDISEAGGYKSAFYFICGQTHPDKDADYKIEHPVIRDLLKRIHKRGHEIGLHPSYNTFRDPIALMHEAQRLKKICGEEEIQQDKWGGRMHYLRWEHPTTLRVLNDAGMAYDSSMGYADQPGFRCGSCFEYPAFDPVADTSLPLRIRPLIVMDTTILSSTYLGLTIGDSADQKIEQLKRSCQSVAGCFTLLWHNCQFEKQEERDLYQQLLNPIQ